MKPLDKIKQLQQDLKGSRYEYAIRLFTKQEWIALNQANNAEDVNWVEVAADLFQDFEHNEKIVEVNANGIPEHFHVSEYEQIYAAIPL